MEPLGDKIKKDIIPHATRNIEIIYEAGRTFMTKQDEKLLAAYINLHDFEEEMQATADRLFRESVPVNKELDALREELMNLQATFNNCSSLADKLSDTSYSDDKVSLENLATSQVETAKEISFYNDKLITLFHTIETLSKEVDKYNKAKEKECDSLYSEYAEIELAHSKNWEKNSINIVAFEEEHARFYSYRTVNEERRESLMKFCDEAINNYTKLNLQTTTLYNVWTEFVKRCNLLRAVAELHSSALAISNN